MAISFNSLGGYGRLGNQMFQYASLRGIANEHGYDFMVPETGHRLFDLFEMTNCINRQENKIVMHNLTHKGFEFDRDLLETCPNYTDLYGYFQSEKYFDAIQDSIREDFTFKEHDLEALNRLRSMSDGRKIASVHVRRGDYMSLQEYHPLVGINYYKEAMEILKDSMFVVFSDDPEWCQSQDIFSECLIANAPDHTSMYLMTKFDHNIIANSSFSWWGAWLNNNYQKVVIAPKKWFGPAYSSYDLSDLYPSRWILL